MAVMFEYSGWNPYATLEMAESTVADAIASCFGSLRPDLRHGVEAVVMRNLPTATSICQEEHPPLS